ncbi:MAG: NADP-specific glutamate dehydrogenase [Candidatus Vogelbacteria bacterium CG10_big_fil_rev_8_21_14_0_10_45_14]|uniref:Glutamate dehydrogenase n=1 Tax=Candidatus Vogelbacteria bacterium CG10_big_fil_rev_8_21_14_0_10_45_14 TaxID=1975042 RepID=A0A2H0RKT4_9BACT|nr:MAG: NADP-specific glutamate dehydrogenase [Candidatus Vogelbacteria bacterium CG10_big_fil_rev_8_21_14_0_10_45_14]
MKKVRRDEATGGTFLKLLEKRCGSEPLFLQAVEEFIASIASFLSKNSVLYKNHKVLERITEPERIISFRVVWEDDRGEININRGYRVQFSSLLGPYKGGLRFHPSVDISMLKFLGFEQIFKNALTGLPLGGGKGGADFDPKGRSDREIMRFCQAYMTELSRYIGKDVDIPAGDIGVGAREINYLFGQHKKLTNRYEGAITGKGLSSGGTFVRPEATGYGVVYFLEEMLARVGEQVQGKTAIVSGSGNVAQHTARKFSELGGKVLTMSDSSGYIFDPDGIEEEKLDFVMELKNVRHGRISEYAKHYRKASYHSGRRPWERKADFAIPCATQNEIEDDDADNLVKNGISLVIEGANMPTSLSAVKKIVDSGIMFAPGKAANAGGVAVSGLEMAQNSLHLQWTRNEVDTRLREIMCNIHTKCVQHGSDKDNAVDYVKGANIASFIKVSEALISQGII